MGDYLTIQERARIFAVQYAKFCRKIDQIIRILITMINKRQENLKNS